MPRSPFNFRLRRREEPVLRGQSVVLRIPRVNDYEEWSGLRERSRPFLEPWEPQWPTDDLTRPAFRHRIRRYDADRINGLALPLFIFRKEDDCLVGGLTIGSIRRGAAESCMLGYWMGHEHSGQGLMGEALSVTIPHIFERLRLHRIEAACIPDNERSLYLLEKVGFQREGYMQGYLRINGAWRDHILFALVAEDWWAQKATMKAIE